ncbi:MAG: class I SAM-dependent methyltransferase [Thermoguttaceae bacterium]|nr:class I SAM-dependent methyltransferase [Thermoguttaceae bacterium]
MDTSYSDGIFYDNNHRINPFLISVTKTISPGIVIDYGCGIGTNAQYLKQLGWEVFVVEKEPIAISSLRKKFETERIVVGDCTSLDFSRLPTCDLAICNYVLQHFSVEAAEIFLLNVVSKVKEDGYLQISLFDRENVITSTQINSLFRNNGCVLLEQKYWTRWDHDHGPVHFHKGYESFWKKK